MAAALANNSAEEGDRCVISEKDIAEAEEFKKKGNEFFSHGSFLEALHEYGEAIKINPNNAVYYSNRSIANLKSEYPGAALQDATCAIEKDPAYLKAYYRRASAYLQLNKYKEAIRDLESVARVRPNDKECLQKLNACKKEFQRRQFLKAIETVEVCVFDKLKPENLQIEGTYDGPVMLNRVVDGEFVKKLIEFQKDGSKLHKKFVYDMILLIRDYYQDQPSMIDIEIAEDAQLNVCGDIHGQYYDLLNIFKLAGEPSEKNLFLFNGDFVDRGSFSCECIILLFAYKLLYPKHFHLVRGNHEADSMNQTYGFLGELNSKYGKDSYEYFREIFNSLPLAHYINKKVLAMHGGIPCDEKITLDDIRSIDRFHQPPDCGAFCELLWNDPNNEIRGKKSSKRGIGFEFGPDISAAFCRRNNIDYVIRSHEMKPEGYEVQHSGQVITIFSAPNYCDQMGNKGAFIQLRGNDSLLKPNFVQFDAVPHPNVPSMSYAPKLFF